MNALPVASDLFALGTVQLGMPYGVANRQGMPDEQAAHEVLATAWRLGVRCFDTAQAYGKSEEVLGRFLAGLQSASDAQIITKLHPSLDLSREDSIRASVEKSLRVLGIPRLWAVLLHREDFLAAWPGVLGRTLRALVKEGVVEHVGLSVYSPETARAACEADGLDIVQLPSSCLDRRMDRSGLMLQAARQGVEVFVRSVFLQGLLLLEPTAVPAHIPRAREAVELLHDFCQKRGLSPRRFALDYVRVRWPSARLVLGAEAARQIEENVQLLQIKPADSACMDAWDSAWPEDCQPLVNPASWPTA